jgi:hypothetical protein
LPEWWSSYTEAEAWANLKEGLLLIPFALAWIALTTLMRAISAPRNRERMLEIIRHNPWYVILRGRYLTTEEVRPFYGLFLKVYWLMASLFRWVGFLMLALALWQSAYAAARIVL